MPNSKNSSTSKKYHYSSYQNTGSWRKNKLRTLKRHIRLFPADLQAQKGLAILQEGGVQYARKAPHKRIWRRNKTKMVFAHTLRWLGGKGDTVLTMPWDLGHPERTTILPVMRDGDVSL